MQNALQELLHQKKEISAADIWPRNGLLLVLIWQTGADHLSSVFSCGVWGGCGCVVQFCYLGQDEVTKILQDAVETKMKAVLWAKGPWPSLELPV